VTRLFLQKRGKREKVTFCNKMKKVQKGNFREEIDQVLLRFPTKEQRISGRNKAQSENEGCFSDFGVAE
jgi:hypothetical protein